jgi:hypothetical protein
MTVSSPSVGQTFLSAWQAGMPAPPRATNHSSTGERYFPPSRSLIGPLTASAQMA